MNMWDAVVAASFTKRTNNQNTVLLPVYVTWLHAFLNQTLLSLIHFFHFGIFNRLACGGIEHWLCIHNVCIYMLRKLSDTEQYKHSHGISTSNEVCTHRVQCWNVCNQKTKTNIYILKHWINCASCETYAVTLLKIRGRFS